MEVEEDEIDGINELGSPETIHKLDNVNHHGSSFDMINEKFSHLPERHDYMAVHETIDKQTRS